MRFEVNFKNKRRISCCIDDNLVSTTHIEVPVEEIISMMHDIADDWGLVRLRDRMELSHAAGRIISYLEEENEISN